MAVQSTILAKSVNSPILVLITSTKEQQSSAKSTSIFESMIETLVLITSTTEQQLVSISINSSIFESTTDRFSSMISSPSRIISSPSKTISTFESISSTT